MTSDTLDQDGQGVEEAGELLEDEVMTDGGHDLSKDKEYLAGLRERISQKKEEISDSALPYAAGFATSSAGLYAFNDDIVESGHETANYLSMAGDALQGAAASSPELAGGLVLGGATVYTGAKAAQNYLKGDSE